MRCMRERCGAAWSVELQCARVDGVYELLLHGTGVARELFVSVRFLFLPGIWAYVVHRRESGSPVWYRTYSKKKKLVKLLR